MVKNIRHKPWFDLYQHYVKDNNFTDRAEKKWAYVFAKRKYKFLNPKRSDNFLIQQINKIRRPVYDFTNWILATTVIGQFSDEFASKFENITGISKKRAQDWNAIWSSIPELSFVYGGAKISLQSNGYSDFISDFGEQSLYITVPLAVTCLTQNIYRLAKRDNKARPAIGTIGLLSNGFLYMRKNRYDIVKTVKFILESTTKYRQSFYLNDLPLYQDSGKILSSEDKELFLNTTNFLNNQNNLEDIINHE